MRRVGLAAFDNKQTAFDTLGSSILQQQVEELNTQLSVFQNALTFFAMEHGEEIRSNPQFRAQFAKMCTSIGVDPFASSSANKKGTLWGKFLGKDVSDFYFELAVRVIELCRITRNENGGLISISEVKTRLADTSNISSGDITDDDIEQAVKTLNVLGDGFDLQKVGKKMMIRSVPQELSTDQAAILEACQALGYVTVGILQDNLGWKRVRSMMVLTDMLAAGLIWIDEGGTTETQYWLPSWMDL